MKIVYSVIAVVAVCLCPQARADAPKSDYAFVRGVCHTGWAQAQDVVERELDYAQRSQRGPSEG